MENLIKKFKLAVIGVALCALPSFAGTLDDYLIDSSGSFTMTGASSIKTQVRGYHNFGGASVRNYAIGGKIRPFSITAPSIHSGCSGIDAVLGGFSYLNIEYLVEKLQKILSAAPAFAFQIALSTLCKDCQQILDELEAIANAINGINFDGCQAAVNWGKAIGKFLNDNTSVGDNPISQLTSSGSSAISNFKNKFSYYTNRVSATINCTSGSDEEVRDSDGNLEYEVDANGTKKIKTRKTGSYAGICNQSSDKKAGEQLAKLYFQGSYIEYLFSDDAGEKIVSNMKDDTDFSVWFAGRINKGNMEKLFRGMFGDIYGYVDTTNCTSNTGKGETEIEEIVKIMFINPSDGAEQIINTIYYGQKDAPKSLTGIDITNQDATTACSSVKKADNQPAFKAAPAIEHISISLTQNFGEHGEGTIYYYVKNRLAIIGDNWKQYKESSNDELKFLDSVSMPIWEALEAYASEQDDTLLSVITVALLAEKSHAFVDKIIEFATQLSNNAQLVEHNQEVFSAGGGYGTFHDYIREIKKSRDALSKANQEEWKKVITELEKQTKIVQRLEQQKKELMQRAYLGGMNYVY